MGDAHINPRMLRWSMERVGAQPAELGLAFKKPIGEIDRWLSGEATPTFRQAQRLATRLRVPFGFLFLAEPPPDELPLPDFRRAHGAGPLRTSVDLRAVISDVLRKQDWYRDFRLDGDEAPFDFVGSFSFGAPVREVVADISERLEFEEEVRPNSQSSQFLRHFVLRVEALGVLVMRSGIVKQATNRPLDVDEFRGFSVADPMAPVVFVNNADSNAAQAFTLAHELGHLWIGRGGISDADPTIESSATDDIEEYCNEVAAELLLPWGELQSYWTAWDRPVEEFLADVAGRFHVSTVMVARQLWEHGAIDRTEFFRLYEAEKANWRRSESESSGGNYYLSAPIRNSRLLTEAVLESVSASETSIRDASRLLGVKPANLEKLRESMGIR